MKFLKLPENPRFTTKAILLFMLPIFVEQLLLYLMSMADSLMVARSGGGELAMAGMEIVKRIDQLLAQVFIALAAGGSVVTSMYVGAKHKEDANLSMKLCVLCIFVVTFILSFALFIFRKQILFMLYPDAEAGIMNESIRYFTVSILSYPFMALYYTTAACFRAIRKSNITLYGSFLMIAVNLITKYLFIFPLKLDVVGAALSALVAFGLVGFVLLVMLHNKKNEAYIDNILKPAYDGSMVKRIFTIGIPNGIENGLFQLGGLILQGLIVSLGTVATTANALAYNLVFLMASAHNAFLLGILPFVSQCIGAGEQDEAIFYTKHIIKLDYLCVVINYILILPIIRPLANVFGVSPEATEIAVHLMHVYSFFSVFLYPISFTLTNALRGTGDTKFTMVVSVVSMFIFRIGCAYLLAYEFGFGAESMWYAMIGDWVIRAIIFIARFKGGKWKKIKVI